MVSMANMWFGLSIIFAASVISVHAQKCEHLIDIKDGSLAYGDDTVLNKVGGTVTFKCCKGYTLIGDSTLTCQADGEWDKPVPKCLNSCPGFFGLEDGRTKATRKECKNFGAKCELKFTCDPGRERIGPESMTCQGDFTWSGQPPKCIENLCPAIDFIRNGKAEVKSTIKNKFLPVPGTVIEFECDDGFELQGAAKLTCMDTKQWSADVPKCECKNTGPECDEAKEKCPFVIMPHYGHYKRVEKNKTIGKATVELVKCMKPTAMIQPRHRKKITVKCEGGNWGKFHECQDASCPHQEFVKNGFINGHFISIGETRRTRCRRGFKIVGKERQTCSKVDKENKWIPGGTARCKAKQCKECPAIKSITNGAVEEYCNSKNGGKAKFKCDDGFTLLGTAELTCKIDKDTCEWSSDPPTCQQIVSSNDADPDEMPGERMRRVSTNGSGDPDFVEQQPRHRQKRQILDQTKRIQNYRINTIAVNIFISNDEYDFKYIMSNFGGCLLVCRFHRCLTFSYRFTDFGFCRIAIRTIGVENFDTRTYDTSYVSYYLEYH